MQLSQQSSSVRNTGREEKAWIEVDVAGGRTVIRRQRVGYPFHVTRGFYLDAGRPDLLTLYLQSASGGLYAGDRLQFDIVVADGAALCVTTQASTVVHEGRGIGAVQKQSISVGAGALCAMVFDPCVLFPGADLKLETSAQVAEDGVLLFIDGLCWHDPQQRGGSFGRYENAMHIMRPGGALLLSDVGRLRGDQVRQLRGPLGRYQAAATLTMIASLTRLPDRREFEQALSETGCLAGASPAPNNAGLVARILAPTGGDLVRGLEIAFQIAGAAAAGTALARRRK
jgi:urease accessory protein